MRRMFTEKQVKEMVLDTDYSSRDLVVKTLSQTQPNYELDIHSVLNASIIKSDTLYTKFVMIGNVLWLIISGNFVNGNDVANNATLINNQELTLPDKISSKIKRADGTSYNKNTSGTGTERYICGEIFTANIGVLKNCQVILQSPSANHMTLNLFNLGSRTEDSTYFIDIRMPILII